MKSGFDFLNEFYPELYLLGVEAEKNINSEPEACKISLLTLAVKILDIICEKKEIDKEGLSFLKKLDKVKEKGAASEEIIFLLSLIENESEQAQGEALTALMENAVALSSLFIDEFEKMDSDPSGSETSPEEEDLSPDPMLSMKTDINSVINYALWINGIHTVRGIDIMNSSKDAYENLELVIDSKPQVFLPYTANLSYLPAEKNYRINNIPVELNSDYLAGTTEKVKCALTVSLVKNERVLCRETVDVTVLAFDEWHGYGYYPELLTAFVTPNHPSLGKIISRASEILKDWTGDPSMDAYQTKSTGRVIHQAASVFEAIKEEGIVYNVAPASFEEVGQRVRLCDVSLNTKKANCLDFTLLYASCLEAIGLHPVMIITKEHIFPGLWLEEMSFPDSVIYDPSLITKRLVDGVNQIAVLESTLMANGKNATFDEALKIAEHAMTGVKPIECVIDVFRARVTGIVPLPQRVFSDDGWHIKKDDTDTPQGGYIPPEIKKSKVDIDDIPDSEKEIKIIQWERKLLDLGLRNTLINLRPSKTLVPVLSTSLDELEDALSGGAEFSVLERPEDWNISDTKIDFENAHDLGKFSEVLKSEFSNKRLRSVYTEGELNSAMKGLYRSAKSSLEENGANTLYLAMGILRWYETEKSTKPRYAPLVLMPVDIIRKSANRGYTIRQRDEETQMNITILEKIKQDFGITISGLETLPVDESGVDIRKVLTIIRNGIMEQHNWDVLESSYLGIFSFSQFVMWNDLHNRTEDLMNNKVVKSLVDGKISWDAKSFDASQTVNEDEVLLPLPADASQLLAIEKACEGNSFVLHGPPGTGKSQTITSLIANALAMGKSVLFVAEKMAALDVVKKRLEAVGIGAFCLELHSNKSKKRDVLNQLQRATEITRKKSPAQYAKKAEQIKKLREDLDRYATELHRLHKTGYTLYGLIDELEGYTQYPDITPFSADFVNSLDSLMISDHRILIERLVAAGKNVGTPHGHPLSRVGLKTYYQKLKTDAVAGIEEYKKAITAFSEEACEFLSLVQPDAVKSFDVFEKIYLVANELLKWYDAPCELIECESLNVALVDIAEMAQAFITAKNLRENLLVDWKEALLSMDGQQLLNEYNLILNKGVISRFIGNLSFMGKMRGLSRNEFSKDSLLHTLTALCNCQAAEKKSEKLLDKYKEKLGYLYNGEATDWQKILELSASLKESEEKLLGLTGSTAVRKELGGKSEYKELIGKYIISYEHLAEKKNTLYSLLEMDEAQFEAGWLASELSECDVVLSAIDEIREWIAFNVVCADVETAGLYNVIEAYKNGLEPELLFGAYKKGFLYTLICDIIDNNPVLNTFAGTVFNEKIDQLKRIDKEMLELTKEEIYCRLASRIPDFVEEAASSSELGKLQKVIKNGGRGVSIRKLFEDLPTLLPRICPCMLMSPISAAQYLDTKRAPFDLVVFDEASQLPTCKAVGVIARGKDAVVVGDPKQMPPTTFFATNTVDEENIEIEDLESILDDCLALSMPELHLLWHYRSRHESLIAFSNNQFYDNKLFTFPSVNDRETKVSLVEVDGVFERGHKRVNRKEAETVVAELIRRCHTPGLSEQSVGVVTFNISQQFLIDDLLSEACATDSELEKWAYESEEPLFIKNLENVQGDERDVILFSIGYGPDETGKIYMNFGPLNRDGGWRRLNVAVSRARQEMVVFSTLKPEHINLSKTSAKGVSALKAFLEYAGGNALSVDENSSEGFKINKNGIINTICTFLSDNGYKADVNVGHSEYRVDIGVIDPEHEDKYILGILLDGNCYGNSKTTRDREIAQIGVLSGLGWTLTRVWTMDWWDNKDKELARILALLKSETSEPPVEEPASPVEEEADLPNEEEQQVSADEGENIIPYSFAELDTLFLTADEFVSGEYDKDILNNIKTVVDTEAPVAKSRLYKLIINSFGITRAGNRILQYLDLLINSTDYKITNEEGESFFWKGEQNPCEYTLLRTSGNDKKRDASHIPLREAVNGILYVLKKQLSLNNDDLIRETAKLFGYTRKGGYIDELCEKAIISACENNLITKNPNENWIINE